MTPITAASALGTMATAQLTTALARQALWLSNRPVQLATIAGIPICARCRRSTCPPGTRADICVACNLQVCPRF